MMMNVKEAEAQLVLVKAGDKYRTAKAAYQSDSGKKAAFVKARDALVAVRNDWRENFRVAPNGPGDGAASPAPVEVSLEVN